MEWGLRILLEVLLMTFPAQHSSSAMLPGLWLLSQYLLGNTQGLQSLRLAPYVSLLLG